MEKSKAKVKDGTAKLNEVKKVGGNGHKTNWLQILKDHLTGIKGAGWTDENLKTIDSLIDAIKGSTDDWLEAGRLDAILDDILADTGELQTDWADGGRLDAILDLCALEATLTAIKGADFVTGTDSLKILSDVLDAIKAVTDVESGVKADVGTVDTKVGTNVDAAGTTTLFAWLAKLFSSGERSILGNYGKVTTYTDETHFKVSGLTGLGDDYFTDFSIYVVRDAAGAGAAPQGEMQPISDYVSADGTFTHTAFTVALEVDDEVLILHPRLAEVKALVTALGAEFDGSPDLYDVLFTGLDSSGVTNDFDGAIIEILKAGLEKTTGGAFDPDADSNEAISMAIAALNNLSTAEVDACLAAINLDHLMKTVMAAALDTIVEDDTVLGFILAKSDVSDYARTTDSLEALSEAIANTYQEQIPDTDINLQVIDNALALDPPDADEENSVVDLDIVANTTYVLRSLWVNISDFGTDATKLTFALWVTLKDAAVTKVDEVDVDTVCIQNLMDLFGLQEVHADGIWITVVSNGATADAKLTGSYRYAKAVTPAP